MKALATALVAIAVALPLHRPALAQAPAAQSAVPQVVVLPKKTIDVAGHKVVAEVADTPETRERGLMYRFSLAPDEGMLFVFPAPAPQAFWMRHTYVPLSIAYLDAAGRILNIEDMAPRTDDGHLSKGEALYALEMKQGWFARHGIAAGAKVAGLPKPSKR